ncbi:hypothetical protein NPIL_162411 [Nephila pilipes]|uniref:Uncharacterized protein n=1 Tax=Nephila pilipes TaxID=299642 RepID=A0A8X6PFB3_NEPPI|nr:hypothetical protein NPIL_162411 [Nephila pilipes]
MSDRNGDGEDGSKGWKRELIILAWLGTEQGLTREKSFRGFSSVALSTMSSRRVNLFAIRIIIDILSLSYRSTDFIPRATEYGIRREFDDSERVGNLYNFSKL